MEKNHPSRTFHLIYGISSNQTLHWIDDSKGYRLYKNFTFKVGHDYSYDHFTESELNQLRNYEYRKYYDSGIESLCKMLNVPYKTERCKACGGSVRYIIFNPLEFVE